VGVLEMMHKLRSLLDETTILNFNFIFKLGRRYKWIVAVAPFFVALFAGYLYKTQNQIFSGDIAFRFIAENKNTGTTAISALVDEQESGVNTAEILGITESTNFLQGLASDIYDDPDRDKMNFNSIYATKKLSYAEFTETCNSRPCHVKFIRKVVPSLFTMDEDKLIDNKYNVSVRTLDSFTTEKILRHVQKNILKYRLDTIKGQLQDQIRITSQLVKKEEIKASKLGLKEIIQEKSIMIDSLEAVIKKRELYAITLGEKKVELEQAKISLKYTKSTLGKKVSKDDKKRYEQLKNLLLKKDLLTADISALEHSIGENSNQDNAIITSLQDELKKINKELSKLEGSKSSGLLEDFKDQKLKSKGAVEFSIQVLNDQIAGLTKNMENINSQRSDLIKEISNKESYISENEAVLNYLRLLQQKHLQLKLIEDTIVSDLIFDDYLSAKRRYKKYSLIAVIPFTIAIALVLVLLLLIARYSFDSRLFDEEEFKALFADIEFIGEMPEID
jgi:hypothetical protein